MTDPSNRAKLRDELKQLGVKKVTAEYDGSGDSGQIDEPDFGAVWTRAALVPAVQNLFYDILEEHYSGWEINEGSFGKFVWNVTEDDIHLVHNTRLESFETEEQNL